MCACSYRGMLPWDRTGGLPDEVFCCFFSFFFYFLSPFRQTRRCPHPRSRPQISPKERWACDGGGAWEEGYRKYAIKWPMQEKGKGDSAANVGKTKEARVCKVCEPSKGRSGRGGGPKGTKRRKEHFRRSRTPAFSPERGLIKLLGC